MYITAPPVNYSILCLSSIVHIVAFVNLLLKKMVVVVVHYDRLKSITWKHYFIAVDACSVRLLVYRADVMKRTVNLKKRK